MILHIGRKAPKGFIELPGGIHLGRGIWIFKLQNVAVKKTKVRRIKPRGWSRRKK